MNREPTEMELRVAKALFKADDGDEGCACTMMLQPYKPCQQHMFSARAAIRAMREPTEEMIQAGIADHPDGYMNAATWQAMIDAASPPQSGD